MKSEKIEKERSQTKKMIELSALDDTRKQRYLKILPDMSRSQLAKMRSHFMRLLYIESSEEVIDELVKSGNAPKDDGEVVDAVISKWSDKIYETQ